MKASNYTKTMLGCFSVFSACWVNVLGYFLTLGHFFST